MNSFNTWVPALVLIALLIYRFARFARIKKEIPTLIAQGAQIIDVRSEGEFKTASNPQSINIPLDRLSDALIPGSRETPLILCCASGARSGMGVSILKAKGFKRVLNAGPWTNTL